MLWTVLVLMRFMIRDWGLGLGLGPRTWTLYLYRAVLDVCSSGASAMSGWMDGECGSSSFVFLGGVDCSAKGSHVFSRAGLGWVWNLRHGRLYAAVGSDSWTGRVASVAPRCSSFLVDLSVLRRIPDVLTSMDYGLNSDLSNSDLRYIAVCDAVLFLRVLVCSVPE